jgi:hypothetical protein
VVRTVLGPRPTSARWKARPVLTWYWSTIRVINDLLNMSTCRLEITHLPRGRAAQCAAAVACDLLQDRPLLLFEGCRFLMLDELKCLTVVCVRVCVASTWYSYSADLAATLLSVYA